MDEQPPREIWHNPKKVDAWFRDVEEKRTSKYGGGRQKSSYDDADDVPMTSNELAESLRPT